MTDSHGNGIFLYTYHFGDVGAYGGTPPVGDIENEHLLLQ